MRILFRVIIFCALLGYAAPSAAQIELPELTVTALIGRATQQAAVEMTLTAIPQIIPVEPPEMTATAVIERATQQAAIEMTMTAEPIVRQATQQALESNQLQLDGTRQVIALTEVAQNASLAQAAASSASSVIGITLGLIGLFGGLIAVIAARQVASVNKRIEAAANRVKDDPQKAKLSWDLARVALESYFNRNISQITWIFWLSVFVMALGFLIIVFSIFVVIVFPDRLTPVIVTAAAGALTEFIGATFLFIYRSTVQQALSYFVTLERMNSVGMAMQILDTMPDDAVSDDLKNQTKATLISLMIQQSTRNSILPEEKQG